jgi:hypothetical protein
MNGAVSMLRTVIRAQAGIRTVISAKARGDHLCEARPRGDFSMHRAPQTDYLWEARPRGDASLDAPQTFDRGEHPSGHKGAAPTTTPSPSRGEGWGGGERRQATQPSSVRTKPTPTLSFPLDGGADYLWEPRPRGDARLDATRMFDRGEGAAPTKPPSPLTWEARPRAGYCDCLGDVVAMPQRVFGARRPSHSSSQVPPPHSSMALPLSEVPCLHARPDKAVVWFLWEHPQGVGRGCKAAAPRDTPADKAATTSLARPRADYRDCLGDVVAMPQGVFRARRPSHRSSQVPPRNPLSLPDFGVLRNDVLKVRPQ